MANHYIPQDGDTFAVWEQTVSNSEFGYLTVYDAKRPYRDLREVGNHEHWGYYYDYISISGAHLKADFHGVALWPQYLPLKWHMFPQNKS